MLSFFIYYIESGLSQSCVDAWIKKNSDEKEVTNPILLQMGIYVIDTKKKVHRLSKKQHKIFMLELSRVGISLK